MPGLRINHRFTIPEAELEERFSRSSGPGGQHVNKTSSKVELRWNAKASLAVPETYRRRFLAKLKLTVDGEVIVTSEKTRDQSRNREDVRRKLAGLLRTALVRPKPRFKTKPSKGAVERRIEAKKRRSALKKHRRRPGPSE